MLSRNINSIDRLIMVIKIEQLDLFGSCYCVVLYFGHHLCCFSQNSLSLG